MGNELASCAGKSRATKGSKHRKSALRAGEWYNYVVASLTKSCLIVSLNCCRQTWGRISTCFRNYGIWRCFTTIWYKELLSIFFFSYIPMYWCLWHGWHICLIGQLVINLYNTFLINRCHTWQIFDTQKRLIIHYIVLVMGMFKVL